MIEISFFEGSLHPLVAFWANRLGKNKVINKTDSRLDEMREEILEASDEGDIEGVVLRG
jgi:hypothetical protein